MVVINNSTPLCNYGLYLSTILTSTDYYGEVIHGGRDRGARGAMAPPIIWLGAILYLPPPPNILHWN